MCLVESKPIRYKCYNSNNIFFTCFFAQMTSCLVHYDVIYYSFPVNSHYLKMLGVDSPVTNWSWQEERSEWTKWWKNAYIYFQKTLVDNFDSMCILNFHNNCWGFTFLCRCLSKLWSHCCFSWIHIQSWGTIPGISRIK